VDGLEYENWKNDEKTIDAVIRNLEIIGEAANQIPAQIQDKYPEIPWLQMKGMRNILVHEYFGVDIDVIWQTICEDLSSLKIKLQSITFETEEP
jgi:uncharacterized protein with HEPN domain